MGVVCRKSNRGEILWRRRFYSRLLASPRNGRDRKKVIAYAALRSARGLIASAVLAPKFLDLFKDTLDEKVLVVIPNRSTAYVFPALASNYQDYAPLIFAAYRATVFPVSTEVFELSADGMKAVGAFEEP